MVEQVGVPDEVQAAVRIHAPHVFLEFFAVYERVFQLAHQFRFFFGQPVGMGRIEGRKPAVLQGVFFSVQTKHALFRIDSFQQFAVAHAEFGVPIDDGGFQLELNDGDRLVHAGHQAERLLAVRAVCARFGQEGRARVFPVFFHGEGSQRKQVDPVTVFERGQVAVAQGDPDHVGHAAFVAGCGPHPQDVVIAPLDVEIVVVAQRIHDDVRSRPPVVNVPHDVEGVDGKPLDEVAEGYDEVIAPSRGDDRVDDDVKIILLVRFGLRFVPPSH